MTFLISQSEVDSFLACERKHYYAFGEKLQPRQIGEGLMRGIIGHEILATYYSQFIIPGPIAIEVSPKNGTSVAEKIIRSGINENPSSLSMLLELQTLLQNYFEHYEDELDGWEILVVEQEFKLGDFPFKPDLIKRHRSTGKVIVVDHKFLYNFYSDIALEIMPQLAKYVGALRRLGYVVHGAEYNMLRHRKNAKERFRRVSTNLTDKKVETFLHEQDKAMALIAGYRKLPLNEWESKIFRTASYFNCQHCSFLPLCTTDLNGYAGRDLLVRTSYEPNSYGYSDDIEGEII